MDCSGVLAPIPTPTASEDVNVEVLDDYAAFLTSNGVDGLFVCGSIGEFPSLTRDQRRTAIETAVTATDAPVLAGCGETSVPAVRNLIADASAAGADAAVVVPPYYLGTTQDGLRRFFTRVIDEAPLPILLYDVPARTGVQFSIETIADLAARDAVIGLKDTTGDLTHVHDAIEATPDDFAVLQGATELALASLDIGADGAVAGPANVCPNGLAALYAAHKEGDHARAAAIARRVATPIVSAIADIPTPAAMKHLVSRVGFDVGDPIPPLAPLDDPTRADLDTCLDHVRDAAIDLDAASETLTHDHSR